MVIVKPFNLLAFRVSLKVARGYFLGTEVLFSKSSFGHLNLNRFFMSAERFLSNHSNVCMRAVHAQRWMDVTVLCMSTAFSDNLQTRPSRGLCTAGSPLTKMEKKITFK